MATSCVCVCVCVCVCACACVCVCVCVCVWLMLGCLQATGKLLTAVAEIDASLSIMVDCFERLAAQAPRT